MKKLSFLLSALTFMIMAQNTQTFGATEGCTDVTVTYKHEGKIPNGPEIISPVVARNATICNETTPSDAIPFLKDQQTLSFKNTIDNPPPRKEIEITAFLDEHGLPLILAGQHINVVCTCVLGICGNCAATGVPGKGKK